MSVGSHVLPCLLALGVIGALPGQAEAQSSRPVSLQLSATALYTSDGISELIPGGEAQLRVTGGRWSLGGGYQAFTRDDAVTGILFVEPRYRVGSRGAALYVAGRFGTVLGASKAVYGGGGGLLVALGGATNLDLGAQVYSADFRNAVTQVRAGFSFGL